MREPSREEEEEEGGGQGGNSKPGERQEGQEGEEVSWEVSCSCERVEFCRKNVIVRMDKVGGGGVTEITTHLAESI